MSVTPPFFDRSSWLSVPHEARTSRLIDSSKELLLRCHLVLLVSGEPNAESDVKAGGGRTFNEGSNGLKVSSSCGSGPLSMFLQHPKACMLGGNDL